MLDLAAIVRCKKGGDEDYFSVPYCFTKAIATADDWKFRKSGPYLIPGLIHKEWLRALGETSSCFGSSNEVRFRKILFDFLCQMETWDWSPALTQDVTTVIRPALERISRIQNSMEELRSRMVICSFQSDYLITKFRQRSNRILEIITRSFDTAIPANWQWVSVAENHESLPSLLGRFICNMVAAEDLLYLCAEEDWRLAGLSVFLPASCAPCHSRFALVARDLDCTYYMLLALLGVKIAPTAERSASISGALSDASNQDLSLLHKLESGQSIGSVSRDMYDFLLKRKPPSKEAVHFLLKKQRKVYDSLLRKRLEVDALPNTPGLVPDCFWIPGKLEFTIGGAVGSGSFKSVLKCEWLGLDVAIAVYNGEHAKNDLEAEAGILASVQHPNVVNMFGCAFDYEKKEGHLVTELMEQDLRQLIRERAESRGDGEMPFTLSVASDIILQIVEAMIHVHKCRVLHRDLKPANILVSRKKRIGGIDGEETYFVVKVIDFGSAKVRGADASTCHTRKQGTTAYMAPELHAMPKDCAYKWPADVYSLGMTMYEILTGKSPFEGVYTREELVRRVCAGERPSLPEYVPVFWRQLIEKCWHRDPGQRPSFAWIRLKILGESLLAGENPVDMLGLVHIPSEIKVELIENAVERIVNPSLLYRIKSRGVWKKIKSYIVN